ncbi:MAG: class I SAM-dependent methyltransferase [Syntrophales bacterium]|nr:class I SAM-dependent methyltransferase [Syntrophales bacterium]MCK9527992.1 class I SAM-dependent methyltransferase [Syntrophales bacterium]MDX9921431.1 class I SAM-dependent methyltransferase [Syntrophales bacterium]
MNIPGNHSADISTADFERLVRVVRERPVSPIKGFWMNIIVYRGFRFIQGDLEDEASPEGTLRHIGALVENVRCEDIDDFWPEIEGHPIDEREERLFIGHIARRGNNDVELIVPERNRQCPVAWGRFDESPEFGIYENVIYPAVIEALESCRAARPTTPWNEHPDPRNNDETWIGEHLLDVGCGSGDLIASIQRTWNETKDPSTGSLRRRPPPCCWGIDINADNIEAARGKGIHRVFLGDGEDVGSILASGAMFDTIVFSGLLNRQVTSREKSRSILAGTINRLKTGGHVIITGYTSCHFTAEDLSSMGLKVVQKSIPDNIFKDYQNYALRQLYIAEKI